MNNLAKQITEELGQDSTVKNAIVRATRDANQLLLDAKKAAALAEFELAQVTHDVEAEIGYAKADLSLCSASDIAGQLKFENQVEAVEANMAKRVETATKAVAKAKAYLAKVQEKYNFLFAEVSTPAAPATEVQA